jgi:NodT family efflux transporter outer membrane factor (OMF) lipoprotein
MPITPGVSNNPLLHRPAHQTFPPGDLIMHRSTLFVQPRRSCRWSLLTLVALSVCGCTPLGEYVDNGFKVGPNYKKPPAAVAPAWIDANDVRVRSQEADDSHWWTVFNDPVLDQLVQTAYHQNLSLREAGFRVLQNRALLAESIGNLFPQTQQMDGGYDRTNLSRETANKVGVPQSNFSTWSYGFGMAWEIDFWGRFRRAVESASDELEASVDNYDDVLVTLIGDVASTYVQVRTLQQQIAYARETLALQRQSLEIATAKFKGGQTSQVDVNQAQSDVSTTEGLVEQLLIPLRLATDRLCVLLGQPPEELLNRIGDRPIPVAPTEAILGVPADLLRRRPDVRKAERLVASQNAQVGVAVAALYPQISIDGTMGWSAQNFKGLFAGDAFRGTVGPSFTWNILNYGRLLSNIRAQDANFQALVATYQNTVLQAGADVEDGLVTFLRAQKRARFDTEAVNAETAAFKEALAQYKGGLVDFNRVVLIQERLVERQQELAAAQGQIPQGLIQVYRAVGGGWQIRLDAQPGQAPPEAAPAERLGRLPGEAPGRAKLSGPVALP